VDERDDRQTHYYSYGPFQSSASSEKDKNTDREASTTYTTDSGETSRAEVTYPRMLRPLDPSSAGTVYKDGWHGHVPQKRKFAFKKLAAGLAGALAVIVLMFAADKLDLFSNAQAMSGQSSAGEQNMAANDDGSGHSTVTSAALGIERPTTIADIVEESSPAIVKIETLSTQRSRSPSPFFDDEFFRYFFGQPYPAVPETGEKTLTGMGSGFIFEKNGYILTNEHVVAGADEIYVTVEGYTEKFKAQLLGSDYDLDLAVLKIEGDEDFPTLPLGDSSKLRVGDWVTAIGNPLGFDHTVSVGVVSAKEREITIRDGNGQRRYEHLLQTDASINPGNSGGPLLNLDGEVIGINTAVSTEGQGIGFAIPTSTIVDVLDQLKNNKPIPKPYIGVGLYDIDERWLKDLKLDSTEGALIVQVETSSPAARAGLKVYDVIVEVNGKAVKNSDELVGMIREMEVGEKATLKVKRDGQTLEVGVIIGDSGQRR
jgi:Do/DeqQ family serine protease